MPPPVPCVLTVPGDDRPGLTRGLRASLLGEGPAVAPLPPQPAAALAAVAPAAELEADDVALIVTTSGSTGTPKAVLLSRSAVLASAAATREVLGGPGHWHLALPAHYVAGAMVVARAVLDGHDPVPVEAKLADLHRQPGRNYLSVIPTQLARARTDPALLAELARFDAILVGGAALADDLRRDLTDRGLPLVTTYGMSETCGGCVYDGVPLPGVRVGFDGPDATQGRILLRTPTAFSGYRRRPDLTAATLRGDTVATQDRGRLVEGRLTVLGRLDEVVISGGVNVDLAALERRLTAAAGHADLAVVGVPDPEWGTRIVLLSTDPRTLEQWLALVPDLEPAARPRALRRVDRLPTLSTGKLDRGRCRELAR